MSTTLTSMRQMFDLADEVRRMFAEPASLDAPGLYPQVDIRVTGDEVILTAELPGVSREALVIEVEGRQLALRGEKPAPAEHEGALAVHRERRYGRFERTFELGFDVDRDQIEADFRDGVLSVRLPKQEAAKPRRIEVRGA